MIGTLGLGTAPQGGERSSWYRDRVSCGSVPGLPPEFDLAGPGLEQLEDQKAPGSSLPASGLLKVKWQGKKSGLWTPHRCRGTL